jgi:peptide/nickel transport system ATP-binding protein
VSAPILAFEAVTKRFGGSGFPWRRRETLAVDSVTVELAIGETLGIVGESGSGKSTLLRMAMRLLAPSAGSILLDGRDIWGMGGRELMRFRRTVQPVFQDPGASFNPRQPVRSILLAPLEVHGLGDRRERAARVDEVMRLVGLGPSLLDRLPHQLSGGQKQRVAIARAVILHPRILLLDEPTSALDVSIQAQVLNLVATLRRELHLTCVFVSHNLAVVRHIADRVVVMRAGRVVETGTAAGLFAAPEHPYTQALVAAVPDTRRSLAARSPAPRSPVLAKEELSP